MAGYSAGGKCKLRAVRSTLCYSADALPAVSLVARPQQVCRNLVNAGWPSASDSELANADATGGERLPRTLAGRNRQPPLPDNGEEAAASCLSVFGGAIRANHHFLDDFLAFATRNIRVVLLAFAVLVAANEGVGPGTVRIVLAAPFQDKVLTGSPGRHDALTQLTAEHGNEPTDALSRWLMSRKGWRPSWGRPEECRSRSTGPRRRGPQTVKEAMACQFADRHEKGSVPSDGTMVRWAAQAKGAVRRQSVGNGHRVEPVLLLSVGSGPKV
jgi:hypothetical protein